jgi:hypothetical protein
MRPLIVLVLVLLAAAGVVFGMLLLGDKGGPNGNQGVGPAAPTPVASEPERPTGALAQVDDAPDAERGAIEVPEVEPAEDLEVGRPGQGNRLIGRVVDADGRPVADATLRLSSRPMMGDALVLEFFSPTRKPVSPITVRSNAAGEYVFRDVSPRTDYYLKADHEAYASVQESLVAVGERGEFTGPEIVLRLGSGLTGYVRDVGNNPVPDTELLLDSAYVMNWEAENPDRLVARSDNTGYYEFKNVPQGPRNLMVRADGYGVQVRSGNDLQFKGEPGDTRQIDFVLEPGFPIHGQVLDPEGMGVADAKVSAVHFQNQTTSRGEAVTDELGRFRIENLRDGSYIMMVQAPGFSQERLNRVPAGKVDVIIDLKRQACVAGRLIAPGGGAPALRVELQRTSPKTSPNEIQIFESTNIAADVVAGGDGSFKLCGVEPGYYMVVGSGEGYAPTSSNTFQVLDGQDPPPVAVTLQVGGTIRGRVVDAGGSPVVGATVISRDQQTPDNGNDAFFGSFVTSTATERSGRTNAEGEFVLPNLAPGNYKVVIDHPQSAGATLTGLQVSDGQTVQASQTTLLEGGTVRGNVIQGGAPVQRAFLQLYSTVEASRSYQARSDAEGRFEFKHVRPGTYKLTATRSSPTSSSDPFQAILDQQASEVVLTVSEGLPTTRELNLGG